MTQRERHKMACQGWEDGADNWPRLVNPEPEEYAHGYRLGTKARVEAFEALALHYGVEVPQVPPSVD